MLGYIISDKENINVEEHEIQRFNILHKTNLNIFIVKNNKVLYINNIINYACYFGHIQVLKWFQKSGNTLKYSKSAIYNASLYNYTKILEWFKNRNIKKVIKWSSKSLKTIKYKTKNNYIKGYNKN